MSNKVIWKFEVPLVDGFSIRMPEKAELLHFAMQEDVPTLWALVDPEAPIENRRFALFGTGQEYSYFDLVRYVGTIQEREFVWHLFEDRRAQ